MRALPLLLISAVGGAALIAARQAVAAPAALNRHAEPAASWDVGGWNVGAVDWSRVRYFQAAEFAHLDHINPAAIYALDKLRAALGVPVVVSPAPGSTARFSGSTSTRHYAVGRKCDAIDCLTPRGRTLRQVFEAAQRIPEIGGFGLYPDWSPRPGFHIDTRKREGGRLATWMGLDGEAGQVYAALDWSRLDAIGVIA